MELSNGFSHRNQKSFKTLSLYIKIHHLSREENIFQIMLTLLQVQNCDSLLNPNHNRSASGSDVSASSELAERARSPRLTGTSTSPR